MKHEELVSELETIKRLLDRNKPQINPASQRLSGLIRDLAKGEARYEMV